MEGETCQITVEPGITISASRTTSRDIRRHKATAQQVVAQLAINPNTVHKAYRELEREGLVRARPGLGTFVTRAPSGPDPATQARFLAAMTDWLRSARVAGLGPDDIEAIYRTAFRTCFAEGVA